MSVLSLLDFNIRCPLLALHSFYLLSQKTYAIHLCCWVLLCEKRMTSVQILSFLLLDLKLKTFYSCFTPLHHQHPFSKKVYAIRLCCWVLFCAKHRYVQPMLAFSLLQAFKNPNQIPNIVMALLWQTLAIKKKLSMVVVMFASKCLDNPLHPAILSKKGIFFAVSLFSRCVRHQEAL
jgi:hypothetical protein